MSWLLPMASLGLTAYYGNNFQVSDLDATHGTLSGASGCALLGTSSAALAVSGMAMMEWMKFSYKMKSGTIQISNMETKYARMMQHFWNLMFLFYILVIVTSALTITLVSDFYGQHVSAGSNGVLSDSFGSSLMGLDYASISVGGIAFLVYTFASMNKNGEPMPQIKEVD